MGRYLNPGNNAFASIRKSPYVDKTGLIAYINSTIYTRPGRLTCCSRPRRFGKSFAADMLCAYYDCSCNSEALFADLEIGKDRSFREHLNRYNVVLLDMANFLASAKDYGIDPVSHMRTALLEELRQAFPACVTGACKNVADALYAIVDAGHRSFIFVIDEWDALLRESKQEDGLLRDYVWFLRNLFKNPVTENTIAAAYITGILPIKKYGTESALTDFQEFTMVQPADLTPYVGFLEAEVQALCQQSGMDFDEMKQWYDGYAFPEAQSIYNPYAVMQAIRRKSIENYWTQSETYESLKGYISMNFDGLKDAIVAMLAGQAVRVNVRTFQNDITSFRNKDDVLTLLIHLGYFSYHHREGTITIPNQEVADVFSDAVSGDDWKDIEAVLQQSEKLLEATWQMDAPAVAEALEQVHSSCASILQYNNEASLRSAIMLAYYTARRYYQIIPEFPTGKGFADLLFLPKKHCSKPAMLIELKYNQDADTAIRQIHENRYPGDLQRYFGNLLLVGINYDKAAKGKNAKQHSCMIEAWGEAL